MNGFGLSGWSWRKPNLTREQGAPIRFVGVDGAGRQAEERQNAIEAPRWRSGRRSVSGSCITIGPAAQPSARHARCATLPLPPMRGPTMLEIHLAVTMIYVVDAVPMDGNERRAA